MVMASLNNRLLYMIHAKGLLRGGTSWRSSLEEQHVPFRKGGKSDVGILPIENESVGRVQQAKEPDTEQDLIGNDHTQVVPHRIRRENSAYCERCDTY